MLDGKVAEVKLKLYGVVCAGMLIDDHDLLEALPVGVDLEVNGRPESFFVEDVVPVLPVRNLALNMGGKGTSHHGFISVLIAVMELDPVISEFRKRGVVRGLGLPELSGDKVKRGINLVKLVPVLIVLVRNETAVEERAVSIIEDLLRQRPE